MVYLKWSVLLCACVLTNVSNVTMIWYRGWLPTLEILGSYVKEKRSGHSTPNNSIDHVFLDVCSGNS